MLFFRVLVFVALACGFAIMLYYLNILRSALSVEVLLLTAWALFTPQVFASAKAFSIMQTDGFTSRYMNQTFADSVKAEMHTADIIKCQFYGALPLVVLVIWVGGFITYLLVILR